MANVDVKRYRFTVPSQDEYVQRWLESQINISMSIRTLIREDIQKNGYSDVTCREVEQRPKVGRPTAAELERRNQQKEAEQVEVTREVETVRTPVVNNYNQVQPVQHVMPTPPSIPVVPVVTPGGDNDDETLRQMGIL